MRDVVAKVRSSPRPYFIEARTYRFMGHSMADPSHGHYRTKDEVEAERKRDPLLRLRQTMLERSAATEAEFDLMDRDIEEVVDQAVRFADESPFPGPDELHRDVYVE
jgi:pyruvate dehydrogenase E1 component alpha subunit